jgi:hypothetical protein
MCGLQMGSRFRFVDRSLGLPGVSSQIFQGFKEHFDGAWLFLRNGYVGRSAELAKSVERMEMMPGSLSRLGITPAVISEKANTPDSIRRTIQRSWLRPDDVEWQMRTLRDAGSASEIAALARSLSEESGSRGAVAALTYLTSLNASSRKEIPESASVIAELGDRLPEPTDLYVKTRTLPKKNLEAARQLEKWYWANPDSGLGDNVFRNYAAAGAYSSARRFYRQMRPDIVDPVAFSGSMGKLAFALGYVLKDREMRQMALRDSQSGSAADMWMRIWNAAAETNLVALRDQVGELVERYGNAQRVGSASRLQKFVPLIPALTDSNHLSHKEALAYFGKANEWVLLRWILIETYNLDVNDSIELLGGRNADPLRKVLSRYLEKDRSGMLAALNEFIATHKGGINEESALARGLYDRLRQAAPIEDSDLRPSGVISTREAVLTKLKEMKR